MLFRKGLSLVLLLICLILPSNIHNSNINDLVCYGIENSSAVLAMNISSKYTNSAYTNSLNIVNVSKQITKNATFPSHIDLLSIVAIESGFNVYAVSNSKAVGLAQILYKKSSFDIETNLTDATVLLISLRQSLGSDDAAIQAYNVGIGNYLNGVRAPGYLQKFKKAKRFMLAADQQPIKEHHV